MMLEGVEEEMDKMVSQSVNEQGVAAASSAAEEFVSKHIPGGSL